MPNFFAMSFEGELAPSFDLKCLHGGHSRLPDGWGIGYYPGGEPSASVLKEPAPRHSSIRSELVKAWEHLASSTFLLHIRAAIWGQPSDANTQPFCRSFGGRDWLFAHSGSLHHRLEIKRNPLIEPTGSTDTEEIFCAMLAFFAEKQWTSMGEVSIPVLRDWLEKLNQHGGLTIVWTDGRDLCVYTDKNDEGSVYLTEVLPPYDLVKFTDNDLEVDLTNRGAMSRKGVILTSSPMERSDTEATWRRLQPGHLVVIRQGIVREQAAPKAALVASPSKQLRQIKKAEVRRFDVYHRTTYKYTKPVERSTHLMRLFPMHDRLQTLLSNELTVSVEGQTREYEDVFGNRVRRMLLETPYTELSIEARSKVELLEVDPLAYHPLRVRSTIPLVWMPWQRHMLQPFLLPPELAESELRELAEYGMSFAVRNDFDVLDTLLDLNQSIFTEYQYKQNTTNLLTTPFDVYANRRGVCQDFTNLFICVARLLGVPARYVCGYLFVPPQSEGQGQRQSQALASHAWVQVYLPEVGWRGFDPTNGILTQTDHVRVAVGRNYVDATPTSGTLYVGGGGETLEVEVRVKPTD